MTREEAVNIIEERICVTEYVENSYVDCVDIEALRMAIKALAQPEQRWTPCSERLPDESGMYVVTAYDGATKRVTYVKYQKRLKRWELTGARAYWRVLAWMPLPEPYGGDNE